MAGVFLKHNPVERRTKMKKVSIEFEPTLQGTMGDLLIALNSEQFVKDLNTFYNDIRALKATNEEQSEVIGKIETSFIEKFNEYL